MLLNVLFLGAASLTLTFFPSALEAVPVPLHPDVQIRPLINLANGTVRLAKDPRDNALYSITQNGAISRIELAAESTSRIAYTSADHGVSGGIQGFAIGPDGAMYITSNQRQGNRNRAIVTRGVPDNSGGRLWTVLARTEDYERCDCIFNHLVNGIVVSPDNRFVFVNSGSRTDHGELQDAGGAFPGLRETALTSIILRLPADGRDLLLPNDRQALRDEGFLFAEGFRNSFDLAFAPNGDLFATENGPDADFPEELNWVRQGRHYGFPWRFGSFDNPMRFPDYDPQQDKVINPRSTAANQGYYYNDPSYPPPPMEFTDPVINLGPDADLFRDPADGQIKDASQHGIPLAGLTPHRSPLGLVFDVDRMLSDEFRGDGFLFSIGSQIAANLAFPDSDEDLLHLDLEKRGDQYQMRVRRIADGFSEGPIDAELIGNRIFMVEWAGNHTLWEIALPMGAPTAVEEGASAALPDNFALRQNYPNPFNASTTVEFQVGAAGPVELAMYNVAGQKIRTLLSAALSPGQYSATWDGRDEKGEEAASGVYLYRLTADSFQATRLLLLVR
jgi:hypothetical protein